MQHQKAIPMRKFIRYTLPFMLIAMFSTGCEDYLDINEDPNRVTEVDLASLLSPIQLNLANTHYSLVFSTGQITQHLGSYFDYIDEGTLLLGGAWSTIYLRVLQNARTMGEQAAENGSPHYEGIAKFTQAFGLSLLTDQWESVPWSEALRGSEILNPVFDEQEELYVEMNRLLDEAIDLLRTEESIFSPGNDDLIYAGDLDLWVKAAFALKARLAIHLVNKNNSFANAALTAARSAFESPEDDFQYIYNSVIRNPWHTNVALANNTGNFSVAHGAYLIDQMNGVIYDGLEDPRLPIIATLNDGAESFIGIESFNEDAPANTVNFRVTSWHSRETAPMEMLTFAEVKFIEAEAQLKLGQAELAYEAYLDGIQASMDKLGVEASAAAAYLQDPQVAVGANSLGLEQVMREKYIALFLNQEVWVDMRRHNYSDEIYRDFVVPDPVRWGGPAQRAFYPLDEINRNGTEVNKVTRPYSERMWRDQ